MTMDAELFMPLPTEGLFRRLDSSIHRMVILMGTSVRRMEDSLGARQSPLIACMQPVAQIALIGKEKP
ncbi:hypothetical protein FNH09_07485 [Streptomyces adustus]|uniref:Uncharacterized protein n=1 Tax=Streptomyces adustus TaxID=1609272 RepID=A0A5N8VAU8_9ACTN|nr:hypothetical protein [Streptomyces adustus]MPY31158.1 hypothetical protein [Streptomyces adustus]